MVPLSGVTAPLASRSSVVFPAPEGSDDGDPFSDSDAQRHVVDDDVAVERFGQTIES